MGALAVWFLARRDLSLAAQKALSFSALALDASVVASFVVLYYAYEPDTPVRQIMILPVVEAAVRYGVLGGVLLPVIARSIAEAHGGTLEVRSDPGAGAAFTVRLPIG